MLCISRPSRKLGSISWTLLIDVLVHSVQGLPKECFTGLVNFVISVAYHFCLNLPTAFSRNLRNTLLAILRP